MITCTRRIQFCAGHRVFGHESKCATPHGHNYVALIYARAPDLDAIGRVIDFSVLKEKVGGWIDKYWDHAFLVSRDDGSMIGALEAVDDSKKPAFVCSFNPTAEEMARFLLKKVCPEVLHGTGVEAYKIELWETENCFATAELP